MCLRRCCSSFRFRTLCSNLLAQRLSSHVIDDVVSAAGLPAGYGALVIGYRDGSTTVYKTYGQATVDGTVPPE